MPDQESTRPSQEALSVDPEICHLTEMANHKRIYGTGTWGEKKYWGKTSQDRIVILQV